MRWKDYAKKRCKDECPKNKSKKLNQGCKYAASNARISAMHSTSLACTSFAFSNNGLIFSGVIASVGSGSNVPATGCGGIDLTDPVFATGARGLIAPVL